MLIDTTLREGEQTYGVYFTDLIRKDVLLSLHKAGVEEAEVGCVGREGLGELIAWAHECCPGLALSVWCPCRGDMLQKAAGLGADRVSVGVPVSDLHLTARLRWTRQQALERIRDVLVRARRLGILYLSIGLEDATRAEVDFVVQAADTARLNGAARVRLSDTVGHGTPDQMRTLVQRVRATGIAVAVHCHNDFGMATANAVTALQNGAAFADGSLLGIGERAGVAATEELAAFLALRQGAARYDLPVLKSACRRVSVASEVDMSRLRPVTGRDIFACESGLHVHGLVQNPELFEPYEPEAVDASRTVSVGGKTGRAALRHVLSVLGLTVDESYLPGLVAAVRREATSLGRPLNEDEARRLACPVPASEHS